MHSLLSLGLGGQGWRGRHGLFLPQELGVEGLGVSEGVMAIIPPIIHGTEGHRGPYRVLRERRGEARFTQPAVEVGAGELRDWTPVSPDYPGLGRQQGAGHQTPPSWSLGSGRSGFRTARGMWTVLARHSWNPAPPAAA